jgi:hypothetical protein
MILLDSLTAKYTFHNTSNGVSANFTTLSETKTPQQLGLVSDAGTNPTWGGRDGHMVNEDAQGGVQSLILKASRSIDSGTNNARNQGGFASVQITATFEIDGPKDQLYNVSEKDILQGLLRTTGNSNTANSYATAYGSMKTLRTDQTYQQTFSVDATATNAGIERTINGRVVQNATPDFQFTPTSNQSTVNFDSGWQFLTTVSGGQPFIVKADLTAGPGVSLAQATASANFFDTASVQLQATAIPEPGPLVLSMAGLLFLGAVLLRTRNRRLSREIS